MLWGPWRGRDVGVDEGEAGLGMRSNERRAGRARRRPEIYEGGRGPGEGGGRRGRAGKKELDGASASSSVHHPYLH